jgi:hypothetical protein
MASKAADDQLAKSINRLAKAFEDKHKSPKEARIQWASKLQDAGNLTLASTVLAQVLAKDFNEKMAVAGLGLFLASYLLAYGIMNRK